MTGTDMVMPVLGGGRVLVVEDGEDSAASLTALLRLHGFDARTARTGSEAVSTTALFRPHVVIVDLRLPDCDGCDVVRHVRASVHPPGVIVVTGHTEPERKSAAEAAGASAYLYKPADPGELVSWVHRLTDTATTTWEKKRRA
jgi:DNA-binding response OmpR family regulator